MKISQRTIFKFIVAQVIPNNQGVWVIKTQHIVRGGRGRSVGTWEMEKELGMAKWGRKKIRSGNCCFYAQDIGWNLLLESVDIYYLLGLFQATSKDRMDGMYGRKGI